MIALMVLEKLFHCCLEHMGSHKYIQSVFRKLRILLSSGRKDKKLNPKPSLYSRMPTSQKNILYAMLDVVAEHQIFFHLKYKRWDGLTVLESLCKIRCHNFFHSASCQRLKYFLRNMCVNRHTQNIRIRS